MMHNKCYAQLSMSYIFLDYHVTAKIKDLQNSIATKRVMCVPLNAKILDQY